MAGCHGGIHSPAVKGPVYAGIPTCTPGKESRRATRPIVYVVRLGMQAGIQSRLGSARFPAIKAAFFLRVLARHGKRSSTC